MQVDDYLGEVFEWLAAADRRTVAAEMANRALAGELDELRATVATLEELSGVPSPQSMSSFGERLGKMMQEAVDAAEELRAHVEREVRERLEAVEEESGRIIEQGRTEAEEIIQRARSSERAIEERIADLHARHGRALEEIGRLHQHLGVLLASPEPTGEADGAMAQPLQASPDDTVVVGVLAGAALAQEPELDAGDGVADTAAPTMVQPAVNPDGGTTAQHETLSSRSA